MNNNSSCGCSCGTRCCGSEMDKKQIKIDFLYLDLSVCKRCQGSESNLDEAIDEVSGVLKAAGLEVVLSKINITSRELAVKYEFLSSPTIRINGNDIDLDVRESNCVECGDLCGDEVDCRVWVYEDIEYNVPPKAMIINAIFKEIYGGGKVESVQKKEYLLPKNLEDFFDSLNKRVGK